TWRYVVFMKREHSAYLHMRFDFVYSIYLMFILAAVVRHGRLLSRAWRTRGIAAPTVGPDVP
ncbi:MAG TPA: TRAP transporter small permease, partial [Casimicrobiaceae bacterium]